MAKGGRRKLTKNSDKPNTQSETSQSKVSQSTENKFLQMLTYDGK